MATYFIEEPEVLFLLIDIAIQENQQNQSFLINYSLHKNVFTKIIFVIGQLSWTVISLEDITSTDIVQQSSKLCRVYAAKSFGAKRTALQVGWSQDWLEWVQKTKLTITHPIFEREARNFASK